MNDDILSRIQEEILRFPDDFCEDREMVETDVIETDQYTIPYSVTNDNIIVPYFRLVITKTK